MGDEVGDQVFCYSGYTYAQRPHAFILNGERLDVAAIETEWISPGGHGFKVNTSDGRRFKLSYDPGRDQWQIISV